jgi:hypothetical protein
MEFHGFTFFGYSKSKKKPRKRKIFRHKRGWIIAMAMNRSRSVGLSATHLCATRHTFFFVSASEIFWQRQIDFRLVKISHLVMRAYRQGKVNQIKYSKIDHIFYKCRAQRSFSDRFFWAISNITNKILRVPKNAGRFEIHCTVTNVGIQSSMILAEHRCTERVQIDFRRIRCALRLWVTERFDRETLGINYQ